MSAGIPKDADMTDSCPKCGQPWTSPGHQCFNIQDVSDLYPEPDDCPDAERGRVLSCGCVLCICEDPVQCHGCGAKACVMHAPKNASPDAEMTKGLEVQASSVTPTQWASDLLSHHPLVLAIMRRAYSPAKGTGAMMDTNAECLGLSRDVEQLLAIIDRQAKELDNVREQRDGAEDILAEQAEQIKKYQKCQEDVCRLTRDLDIVLCGKDAAERPMLCDVIKTAEDRMAELKAKDEAIMAVLNWLDDLILPVRGKDHAIKRLDQALNKKDTQGAPCEKEG